MDQKLTYRIYIGSNNDTKKLELDKIEEIAGRRHEGFTIYTATGHWLGSKEDTAVLIVFDDELKVNRTITDLKIELDQDAIGYQVDAPLMFA